MPRPSTGTVHMRTALARTNEPARPFMPRPRTGTVVPHSGAQIHTHARSYVQNHRNPRGVRSHMGTTSDTRGTARTLRANTAPSSDRDRSRGPDHWINASASRPNAPSSRASAKSSSTWSLYMTWRWPKKAVQIHGGLVYAHDERHAHTSSGRLEETGLEGAQGPARSGWKGFVPNNLRMQETAPTSPWYSPTHQSGWGTGVQPPSARRLGRGTARCSLCTNAGKPANHPFTACPLTACHKYGQPGHIQCHCPN